MKTTPRITACAALLFAAPAFAQSQPFSAGALIIPEQANFQTTCGAAAAYGLVWQILLSNAPGGYNAAHPVTVYLMINGGKGSPNRCVPSNKNLNPQGGAWDAGAWNDGCDFDIPIGSPPANQPVTQVPIPAAGTISLPALPGGGIYPNTAIQMFSPPSSVQSPQIPAVTLDNAGCPGACTWTDIQYMGGPFVIDNPDVPNVIGFLQNAIATSNTNVTQFLKQCASGSTCDPGQPYADAPDGTCHYVYMHQATVPFSGVVSARLDQAPPKIALLDSNDNAHTPTSNSQVDPGILDNYMSYAGMNYAGAAGCPPASVRAPGFPACARNGGARGSIYEVLTANADMISTAVAPNGVLNANDPMTGNPLYGVFWTPHWVGGDSTYAQYTGLQPTQIQNVLDNIASFVSQKGKGLMGQCASVGTYQGVNTVGNNFYGGGIPPKSPVNATSTQFLTNGEVDINVTTLEGADGRNCTDPNMPVSGSCAVYPTPGNPISQTGDFHNWACTQAVVENYISLDGGYNPGVNRLSVSWDGKQATSVPPMPSGTSGWDYFDTIDLPDGGVVVYMGGHNWSTSGSFPCSKPSMAAVRVILNSLLELGFTPLGPERALSAPVVYDPHDGGTPVLIAGTYQAISYPPLPVVNPYSYDNGSQWVFPMLPGHLRASPLTGGSAVAAGESNFNATSLWDANAILQATSPDSRNLFTYFGGQVQASAQSNAHGVLQSGWQPEIVSGDAGTSDCNASGVATDCVDVLTLSQGPVLTPGSDGICDILESVAVFDWSKVNGGNDYGGHCNAHDMKEVIKNLPKAAAMLQHVRGYCFSSTGGDAPYDPVTNYPRLEPTNAQCNQHGAVNNPTLGGIARSTPAVVPPSPNILDKNAARPTVAYVGGLDGELHAIYVSGGQNYKGPLGGRGSCLTAATDAGIHYPNCSGNSARPAGSSPSNVFSTDYAALFASGSAPAGGTELWAFIPPSQLPGLQTNNARVDSSPAVMDVFVDFTGSGIREWHTVLVTAVGPTGNEVFAMDVTDPLYPVLLWDVIGSQLPWSSGNPIYTPAQFTNDTSLGSLNPIKWKEPGTLFQLTGADPNRVSSHLYDYSDQGSSSHASMGQLRSGLEPVYAAFVASNGSGGPSASPGALELFAIDIATGQKLWQWEEPYSYAPNGVPPVASLLPGTGGAVSRVYVGDQEGNVWEVDANTGINVNNDNAGTPVCNGSATPCNYPAFAAGDGGSAQPITTNIAIARVPAHPDAGVFVPYAGATVLAFGTAGADWAPSTVPGLFHVVAADQSFRRPLTSVATDEAQGVLPELAGFPESFAGPEHLYGAITVAGNSMFFSTSKTTIGNDLSKLSGTGAGATYQINMSTAASGSLSSAFAQATLANFGGLAVFHNTAAGSDALLGLEVGKIANLTIPPGTGTPGPANSLTPRGILYQLMSWFSRFL